MTSTFHFLTFGDQEASECAKDATQGKQDRCGSQITVYEVAIHVRIEQSQNETQNRQKGETVEQEANNPAHLNYLAL
ncbi:MAG: hypothetical protein CMB99_00180 [Flavobacteriaceae bacterium]|nr:hypothetical protein [Flavobacteriaceae bacterium]